MYLTGNRSSRLSLTIRQTKQEEWKENAINDGSKPNDIDNPLLTPDVKLQQDSIVLNDVATSSKSTKQIGNYLLLEFDETSSSTIRMYKAFDVRTRTNYICKVMAIGCYREKLEPYLRAGYHENLNQIHEIILGTMEAYVFFLDHYGDLHGYVRSSRRLKEPEARHLFHQIVSAVSHCHENGIVVRDLKLRKFVFKNPERTQLMLNGFDDSIVLAENDWNAEDILSDKHGCPVYVSPEILCNKATYSGRMADVWSLGVILYTMLAGSYPFHNSNINILFVLIRQGRYHIPASLSSKAKCLLKNILRLKPNERLGASDILNHPWFEQCTLRSEILSVANTKESDQYVPQMNNSQTVNNSFNWFP